MKILFIHHSTGGNLIKEGRLRDEIRKRNPSIQFWDHNYNVFPLFTSLLANTTHLSGLTDNNGRVTGKDYNIVLSNNSPKEYTDIFSQNKNYSPLKYILQFDIIAFKNCYPTTKIVSEDQLKDDMRYYEIIRESIKKYPKKQFVLLTPPPERKERTTLENAQRAKQLVHWLVSKDYQKQTTNLHIFDFFGLLADESGFLRQEYTRFLPFDSHPNRRANETLSPIFAKYLTQIALTHLT